MTYQIPSVIMFLFLFPPIAENFPCGQICCMKARIPLEKEIIATAKITAVMKGSILLTTYV